jgi:hypothetical protein
MFPSGPVVMPVGPLLDCGTGTSVIAKPANARMLLPDSPELGPGLPVGTSDFPPHPAMNKALAISATTTFFIDPSCDSVCGWA